MEHALPCVWLMEMLCCGAILFNIARAKRGRDLHVRRIPGIDAIEEAIGRATEMGRPLFFSIGLGGIDLVTLQAIGLLGYVSKLVARYRSRVIVPVCDPMAMPVVEEVCREGFNAEGHPESFDADDVRFVSSEQFAYAAGCVGIMHREQAASTFFFGSFAAESLILAETGQHIGALQVAGTPSALQIPFFITTCDYTIIGEEYYATTAYLTREPVLLGSLIGQDWSKIFIFAVVVLGAVLSGVPGHLSHLSHLSHHFLEFWKVQP